MDKKINSIKERAVSTGTHAHQNESSSLDRNEEHIPNRMFSLVRSEDQSNNRNSNVDRRSSIYGDSRRFREVPLISLSNNRHLLVSKTPCENYKCSIKLAIRGYNLLLSLTSLAADVDKLQVTKNENYYRKLKFTRKHELETRFNRPFI